MEARDAIADAINHFDWPGEGGDYLAGLLVDALSEQGFSLIRTDDALIEEAICAADRVAADYGDIGETLPTAGWVAELLSQLGAPPQEDDTDV